MRSRFFSVMRAAVLIGALVGLCRAQPAWAGNTGNLSGTVRNDKGAPVAGAHVSAAAPTGSYLTTTDAKGFFSIVNISPDTYVVTVTAAGYRTAALNGANVFQDQTLVVNVTLQAEAKVLGHVTTTAQATNLVQPNVTSNTYNVTAKQMNTILGDSTHHTLYDVLWRTPGVTSGPTSNSPIIRGGTTTEVGWEFEEIPIVDRTVGFYVTELSTTGIGNVEVTTGGLSAQQGGSNGGIVNMVVKQGKYPPFGDVTMSVGGPAYSHQLDTEYGSATADNKWSWFMAGSFTNVDNIYGKPGQFFFENVEGFDFVNTKDTILNVHHHWGASNQNDLQYVADVGVGIFRTSYGAIQGQQLAENGVTFVPGAVGTGCDPANAFVQLDANCMTVSLVSKLHADAWYHWYGIQKLSFSHTINDRSYYRARVAQSRNGYFFDEKWAQNIGEPSFGPETFSGPGNYPAADLWCYGCYYQDRHTLQTFWNIDYANQLSSQHLLKIGTSYEFDTNYRAVADCCTNVGWSFQWPSYDRVTQAPTHIYSAYASDHIAAGKWVFEPGVRWDMERYSISPVLMPTGQPVFGSAQPFSESFTSPRIALTYQLDGANVFRASYEHLGQFIGTAYAENFSDFAYFNSLSACLNPGAGNDPNCISPVYTPQKPTTAKSYDMSWEHNFPNNVSLRISPYWHNNDDYVVEFQILHGPTVFANGAATHTHGVEIGLSREVPVGLSAFFSLTYNDTKSNVLAAQGPYFGSFASSTLANIQAHNFLPASYAAPWSSNLALDWVAKGWEIDSNTTWAAAFPYGVGNLAYGFDSSGNPQINNGNSCTTTANAGLVCLDPREINSFAQSLRGPGWYNENLSISHAFGFGRIGVTVTNLFNDVTNPIPSANFSYLNTDSSNNWTPTGRCGTPQDYNSCFNTYLPASNGVYYPAVGYYQQQSLTPRQVNFWWKVSM
jgi:carboxypeptidase family protein